MNEDRYKKAGVENVEPDITTWRAINGDRHESTKMWQLVAEGDFSDEVKYWLIQVADAILDADTKPAEKGIRDKAIKRATGLEGYEDKHRNLRTLVHTILDLSPTESQPPPAELASHVRNADGEHGVFGKDYEHMSDEELKDVIAAQRKKSNPKT